MAGKNGTTALALKKSRDNAHRRIHSGRKRDGPADPKKKKASVAALKRALENEQQKNQDLAQRMNDLELGRSSGNTRTTQHQHALIRGPYRKDITVALIREHLNLASAKHDEEWNSIRGIIRYAMDGAGLNRSVCWGDQPSRKIAKIEAAVDEQVPEMRRFEHAWATRYLIKETLGGRRSYGADIKNKNSYRSKRRNTLRRARRSASSSSSSSDSDEDIGDGLQTEGAGPSGHGPVIQAAKDDDGDAIEGEGGAGEGEGEGEDEDTS